MKRSSIQQLKLRTRCARYRKLGHWARECPEGNLRTMQRRKVRPTCNEIWGTPKRVRHCSKAHGTKTFFLGASWTFRRSRPWRSPMEYWYPRGTRRSGETRAPQAVSEVRRSQQVLSVCQSDWSGATGLSASPSWSRMCHHFCRWE